MKILLIGTVNGKFDEGMRNIATHIGRGLEKNNEVRYVQLRNIKCIIKELFWCDTVLVCARANRKLYILVKMMEYFRKVSVILVQRPDREFCNMYRRSALKCCFFSISYEDALFIPGIKSERIYRLEVGIDNKRFFPVSEEQRRKLKEQIGLNPDKIFVLHVGHCSKGRRIEKMCELNPDSFERLVITSGMFEDSSIRKCIDDAGIKVIDRYISNIEQYYQAADVYLFPTISGEYVISIPLSIMEALACGTPVVAYNGLNGLSEIELIESSDLRLIDDEEELTQHCIDQSVRKKSTGMLAKLTTWDDIAGRIEKALEVKYG